MQQARALYVFTERTSPHHHLVDRPLPSWRTLFCVARQHATNTEAKGGVARRQSHMYMYVTDFCVSCLLVSPQRMRGRNVQIFVFLSLSAAVVINEEATSYVVYCCLYFPPLRVCMLQNKKVNQSN